MKRVLSLLVLFAVLSPLALLMGCGEKASKEESEAAKNASKVGGPAPAANGAQPNKPRLAPPPP